MVATDTRFDEPVDMTSDTRRQYPNDGQPSVDFPIYSRGNVGEAFPDVISPMSGSLMLEASARSQIRFFLAAGAISKPQVRDPLNALFVQFGGYLYTNVSMARIAAVRAPGFSLDDLDAQYGGVGVLPPYVGRRGDRSLAATLRLGRYASRALRLGDAARAAVAQREVDDWIASLDPVETAEDSDLIARARRASGWFERLNHEMMTVTLHAGSTRVLVERFADSADEPEAANVITSGVGDVESAGPAIALWGLGRQARNDDSIGAHFDDGGDELVGRLRSEPACRDFVAAFDHFIDRFGFHGANELELSAPKWGTDPHLALRIVERLRHAPEERDPRAAGETLAAARIAATERVAAKLPRLRRRLFNLAVRNAGTYAREREATKAALVRALFQSHRALNELAARHGIAREDIYLLVEAELESAIREPDGFEATIAERRVLRNELQQRQPPFWFEGRLPDPAAWSPRNQIIPDASLDLAAIHQGLGVSTGVASGRARVILDPNEPIDLQPDEILIAPQTDPAWTPLFLSAAGVVVEYGAVMSHAAIVARELGIPAVVGVDGATKNIPTGSAVTIDGTTGVVTVAR